MQNALYSDGFIFIGCGGTGAKTAVKLAELAAQDPVWKYEVDERLHFFFVDLDSGDLNKYTNQIRERLGDNVNIGHFQPSEGIQSATTLLAQFKSGIEGLRVDERPNAVQRISTQMWSEDRQAITYESAKFFNFPGMTDITRGAGQVPAVSYVATWQAMKQTYRTPSTLEKTLQRFLQSMVNITAAMTNRSAVPRYTVILVGSLAGGTGRGCSTLVSLKVKELLNRMTRDQVSSYGYFLNHDCFEADVAGDERTAQALNAMTGWSELSAWMRMLDDPGSKARFSLPSHLMPHDENYDVVTPGRMADLKPFDKIGIIGRRNRAGIAARNVEEIYGMLAAGLYLRVIQSDIDSQLSNLPAKHFSIGTAVAEIPYYDIEEFLNDKARVDLASRIRQGDTAAVQSHADSVMSLLGLTPANIEQFLEASASKSDASVLSKLALVMDTHSTGRLKALRTQMTDQEVDGAKQALRRALDPQALRDELRPKIGDAYVRLLAEDLSSRDSLLSQMGDPRAMVVGAVWQALVGGGANGDSVLEQTGSLEVVKQVATAIKSALEGLGDRAGSLGKAKISESGYLQGRIGAADALEKAAQSREGFLKLGKTFSPEETVEVCKKAEMELRMLYLDLLREALAERSPMKVGQAEGLCAEIGKNMDVVRDHSGALARIIGEFAENINPVELEKTEIRLFSDPKRLNESLGNSDEKEAGYMLRRRICPLNPFTKEQTPTLMWSQLGQYINKYFKTRAGTSSRSMNEDEMRDLRGAFRAVRYGRDGHSLLESMTLDRVLGELIEPWESYLTHKLQDDQNEYEDLAQKFRKFFGTELKRTTSNEVKLVAIGGDETIVGRSHVMLLGLARIAAQTCRPFWTTRNNALETRIGVQLPVEVEAAKRSSWESALRVAAGPGNDSAVTLYAGGSKPNPYVLIVYTSAGEGDIDDVTSLDAWQRDPLLQRYLKESEEFAPMMPFRKFWSDYRGSGFSSPFYVLDPDVRKVRWAPWLKTPGSQEAAEEKLGTLSLALGYALVGPEWFLRRDKTEELVGNSPFGPILKIGDHGKVYLRRKPAVFERYTQKAKDSADANSGSGRFTEDFKGDTRPGNHSADLPAVKTYLFESCDDVAAKCLSEDARMRDPNVAMLCDDMTAEWQSFIQHVAYECGWDPKDNPEAYRAVLIDLNSYADRKVSESSKASALWRAVARACGSTVRAMAPR